MSTGEVRYLADPATALEDCREAHQWATREIARSTDQSAYWLNEERKRLAGLFAAIRAQL